MEALKSVLYGMYCTSLSSRLSAVPYFDIIQGTSVDYMHCILLGVCRHLLKLWINTSNHNSSWYIGKDVKHLHKHLLLIKPPSEMQRIARSLETTLKFWKGTCMCTVCECIIHIHVHVHLHVVEAGSQGLVLH